MIIDQIRTLGLDCEIDIQRTIQMVQKHNIYDWQLKHKSFYPSFFFFTDMELVEL